MDPNGFPEPCRDRDGAKQLTLTFSGDERSDWINFVLKDGNSWYDNTGTNFHVPLRGEATTVAEPERQKQVRPLLSAASGLDMDRGNKRYHVAWRNNDRSLSCYSDSAEA